MTATDVGRSKASKPDFAVDSRPCVFDACSLGFESTTRLHFCIRGKQRVIGKLQPARLRVASIAHRKHRGRFCMSGSELLCSPGASPFPMQKLENSIVQQAV